ncbi:MAG TPA: BlaI/MecI/CopY family transcriptional regulator [Thermoplasmata archaeon]|nr:BlaI/MecI/CopY family transcriptional regulator [Thermoplasmata archaeon]
MLGPLEQEIVAALKELREGNTRAVLEGLRRRNKRVAYTTVSTVLTRLQAKGVIERRSESFKGGERYIYVYRDIEDAYIDDLLGGLVSTFGRPGVEHLAHRLEGLGEDDLKRLRERLRA